MIAYIRKLLGLCNHKWEIRVTNSKAIKKGSKTRIYTSHMYDCEYCGNMKIVKTK